MASDKLHEDMLRWLREKGHSDEEIEGILARVRQYENQVQHDSVMDSIATDSFNIGVLFAVTNAVMYGSVTAAVRGLSATESAETLTMHQMVWLTLFFAIAMLPFGFAWPGNRDLAALLINGAFNGVGPQYTSCRRAYGQS